MPVSHHADLELMPGDDWVIPFALTDINGGPLDLTDATLQWTLLDPDGNQIVVDPHITTDNPTTTGTGAIAVNKPSPPTYRRVVTPTRCASQSPTPCRPSGSAAFWLTLIRSRHRHHRQQSRSLLTLLCLLFPGGGPGNGAGGKHAGQL